MIQARLQISGEIKERQHLSGSVNGTLKHVYPELENLRVKSGKEEQIFLHPETYGYNQVIVESVGDYNAVIAPDSSESTTFKVLTSLKEIGDLDLTNVTSMKSAFSGYSNLTKIGKISNASKLTTTYEMFKECTSLTSIPEFDTSNVTEMSYMFAGCTSLTSIPEINTSKNTSLAYMFQSSTSLRTIPKIDTSNVTSMMYAFAGCMSLTSIPEINTSKVTSMSNAFRYCTAITSIPVLNAEKLIITTDVLYNCPKLTDFGGFINLGKAYTTEKANVSNYALKLSTCTSLTHDSLMNIINNLYDLNLTYDVANGGTLYRQQLVLGSTNLEKLTAEEIAIATERGWSVS